MIRQMARPVSFIQKRGITFIKMDPPPKPKMNSLPVPQGSWQESYNKMQAKYNKQLVASIAFFVGTCLFGTSTGLVYLNAFPPTPPQN